MLNTINNRTRNKDHFYKEYTKRWDCKQLTLIKVWHVWGSNDCVIGIEQTRQEDKLDTVNNDTQRCSVIRKFIFPWTKFIR